MLPFGFKSKEFADITLKLVHRDKQDEGDSAEADRRVRPKYETGGVYPRLAAASTVPAVKVLSEFPAHRILLAANSGWFKSQLGTWQHNTTNNVLQVQLDPEDVTAFEAIVRHMYESIGSNKGSTSNSVPACVSQLSQTNIVRLLTLCDFYDYAACATDAASALQQTGAANLSWEVVRAAYAMPVDIARQPHMQRVQQVASEKLRMTFQDLEAATRIKDLVKIWRSLPANALAAVLSDTATQVVSEDTVLYAIGDWVNHLQHLPPARVTDMLYKHVRLRQLSPAAYEYLPALCPGFWPYLTNPQRGPQLLGMITSPALANVAGTGLYAKMFTPRPKPAQRSVTLKLSLSTADIQRAEQHGDGKAEKGVNLWRSEPLLHAGFSWHMWARIAKDSPLLVVLQCSISHTETLRADDPNWPSRSVFVKPTSFALRGCPGVGRHTLISRHDGDAVTWAVKRPEAGWQQYMNQDNLLSLEVEFQGPVKCDGTPFLELEAR